METLKIRVGETISCKDTATPDKPRYCECLICRPVFDAALFIETNPVLDWAPALGRAPTLSHFFPANHGQPV